MTSEHHVMASDSEIGQLSRWSLRKAHQERECINLPVTLTLLAVLESTGLKIINTTLRIQTLRSLSITNQLGILHVLVCTLVRVVS